MNTITASQPLPDSLEPIENLGLIDRFQPDECQELRICVVDPSDSLPNMDPIRIGIDFDSTIAQIAEPWLERFNALKGTSLRLSDWSDWNISFIPKKDHPLFFSLLTPDIYDSAEPYARASAVIAKWSVRPNIELCCVTSNPTNDSEAFQIAKAKWLSTHIPCLAGQLISARTKSGLGLDILIDDAPHHQTGDYIPILVRRPWNVRIKSEFAFSEWNEADGVLNKALTKLKRGCAQM